MKLDNGTFNFEVRFSRWLIAFVAIVFIFTGTPLSLAQEESPEDAELVKDSSTEINVKNADIAAIVRIFSKKAKRNYILDERVKGKVSIYLPGKVSSDEAVRILDSVLALKGFTSVPIGENLWKIIPAQEARQTTIPTVREGEAGRGSPSMVTRLINLKYVNADDVKQLITPLVSSAGLVNAYTGTNSLIAIDSEENIVRIMDIIESLDIPFSDREMTIIPIKHADSVELADKINEILGEGKSKNGNGEGAGAMDLVRTRARDNAPVPGQPPVGGAQAIGGPGTSALTVAPRAREPKIIADERTNSIILVADSDTTARIRALVSELDSPIDLSGNRFYVYRCQHADAEELAEVLASLAGEGGGTTGGTSQGGFGSRFGESGNNFDSESNRNIGSRNRGNRSNRTQSRLQDQSRTPGRSRNENKAARGAPASANLGEDISITADPATNSLIINAGKSDYEKILELLKQLDVKRRQVLVEAILLEVTISDQTTLQTNFITSAGGEDGAVLAVNNFNKGITNILANPAAIEGFAVAAASAGVIHLPGGASIPTQTMLISALQNNQNANILSAPTILATDNEEAEIVVGRNVPFISSTAASADNLNNTFNQIDRQDVGITLRITPQISSSDYVTMNLFTEVSDLIGIDPQLGPTTTVRTSETTVITKSGQMIVTGGLMSDTLNETDNGVPYLKDVPVLGHIFRFRSDLQQKTNLLLFITPKIISDQFDARDATVEVRDHMTDEIDRRDIQPRRDEVLQDGNIDKVSESVIYEGQKPSTILPPPDRAQFSQTESGMPAEQTSAQSAPSSDEPLDLRVSPKLPSQQGSALKKEEKVAAIAPPEPKFARGVSVEVAPSDSQGPGQYFVAQLQSEGSGKQPVPFTVSKSSKLTGLMIPAESSPIAQRFFQAGEVYKYGSEGGDQVALRVLGVFSSPAEARGFYPALDERWYTLSPYEIMNLGKGPWLQQ